MLHVIMDLLLPRLLKLEAILKPKALKTYQKQWIKLFVMFAKVQELQ